MEFLKKWIWFYVKSSLHVGVSVFCLVKIIEITHSLHLPVYYNFLVLFGTVVAYNFLKYYWIFYSPKINYKKYFGIAVVTVLSTIGFVFCFLKLDAIIEIQLCIAAILVVMYLKVRKWGLFKPFYVSMVVTYITVFIPMNGICFLTKDLIITLFQQFIILFCLMIPFEIIDIKIDKPHLNTLPQQFGIESTKTLGILLVVPFIVLEFFKSSVWLTVLPIALLVVALINFSSVERSKYYTLFWVESVPIFWFLLLSFYPF